MHIYLFGYVWSCAYVWGMLLDIEVIDVMIAFCYYLLVVS